MAVQTPEATIDEITAQLAAGNEVKTEGDDKPISEAETAAIAAVTEALGA